MSFDIISPANTKELLMMINKYQKKHFRFAAGCTDLLLELKKNPVKDITLINLTQVSDQLFTGINKSSVGIWLGARVTANDILSYDAFKNNNNALYEAALNLASTQIRQVATVGGNLCTASPSGDIACALVALDGNCTILLPNSKKKIIPIREFFVGPRKSMIGKNELLYGVLIPANVRSTKKIVSGFIKIGTRKSMECSVVSLAYHIQVNGKGNIVHSGIAIGASAPTIMFAEDACKFLLGKNIYNISESDRILFAQKVIAYASPISDIRATAWYRKEVLFNISKSILEITDTDIR